MNTGRWSMMEEQRFREGLELYGRSWHSVAEHVETRDMSSCYRHARAYFVTLYLNDEPLPDAVRRSGEGYTVTGKPLDTNQKWLQPKLTSYQRKHGRRLETSSDNGSGDDLAMEDDDANDQMEEQMMEEQDLETALAQIESVRPRSAMELFFEDHRSKDPLAKLCAWKNLSASERAAWEERAGECRWTLELPTETVSYQPAQRREVTGKRFPGRSMVASTTFAVQNVMPEGGGGPEELKEDASRPIKKVRSMAPVAKEEAAGDEEEGEEAQWMKFGNGSLQTAGGELVYELQEASLPQELCGTAWPCRSGLIGCYPLGYVATGRLTASLSCRCLYTMQLEVLNGGARPVFRVRAREEATNGPWIEHRHRSPAQALMQTMRDIFEVPAVSEELALSFWGWDQSPQRRQLQELAEELQYFA